MHVVLPMKKSVPHTRNALPDNNDVAVESISASAVISSAATTAAETATGAFLSGASFVDGQCPTIQLLAVALGNRLGGFFLRSHLHKAKSFGLVSELVHDELATGDVARLFEQIEDVSFCGVK